MAIDAAGILTSTPDLAHLQVIHYNKVGLDRLLPKYQFGVPCKKESLPLGSGRTARWFRYGTLGAQTAPATQGTVGSPLSTPGSRIISATLSQFVNYMSLSDFVVETAPDAIVENHAMLLGEAAGLTVDTMTRSVIDFEYPNSKQDPLSTTFKVADLHAYRANLAASNVEPMEDGNFLVISHPFLTFDLVNDPNALGLGDIVKHTAPMNSPLIKYEDRQTIGVYGGCRVIESTNVATKTSGGTNYWRTYCFGKDGVGCVDLTGKGPSRIKDPKKERFSIKVGRYSGNDPADPAGVIGATVAYNFKTTTVILDNQRIRLTDFSSSIA